jgi:DNA-binding CsgD family transcriptional regulator
MRASRAPCAWRCTASAPSTCSPRAADRWKRRRTCSSRPAQVIAAHALWLAGAPAKIIVRVDAAAAEPGIPASLRARLAGFRALASTRSDTAESANQAAREVLAEARRLNDRPAERVALQALGEIARNELRHEDALACFRALRQETADQNLAAEAAALRLLDRFDEAQAGARTLARLSEELGTPTHRLETAMVLILTAIIRGQVAAARETVARAAIAAERNPAAASLDGIALQVRGLVDGDIGLLARAVGRLESSPRTMLLASAQADYGALLLTQGDRGGAAAALQRAQSAYDDHGAAAPAASVARSLQAAGVSVSSSTAPRRPGTGWAALTSAEFAVAELISAGQTNRLAARALGISPNTVSTHLRSIFAKLDVRSRVQLANRWNGRGYVRSLSPERVRPGALPKAACPSGVTCSRDSARQSPPGPCTPPSRPPSKPKLSAPPPSWPGPPSRPRSPA